jgi:hypothetical protein
MGQTWSMAEAVTRGQGVYDFVWPPDAGNWPYVGGWGDSSAADPGMFFSQYPISGSPEQFPSVSGISIGPSSTVPSVAVAWQENLANPPKELRGVVSVEHPLDTSIPGGFVLTANLFDDMAGANRGMSDVWAQGYQFHLRPVPVFRYREAYYPFNGTAIQPFGSALLPVQNISQTTGVFVPPRLHLRLHLDGSRPIRTPRHPYSMHLLHELALPATEEICGVFPIAGRSSVAVMVSFADANPVGLTASFSISGITPYVRNIIPGFYLGAQWPREVLLWPNAPGGVVNLVGNVNSVARAVFQQLKCDFLVVKAQVNNIAGALLMDVTAED